MNKIKVYNYVLLVLTVLIYLAIYLYWNIYCVTGNCSYDFRNQVLRPLSLGSVYISLIISPFLFLNEQFFKKWLKYIFSWGFPLVVYLTYITTGSSSIPAYGKVDVVKFWGIFFGLVTIIFIAFQYYRSRTLK